MSSAVKPIPAPEPPTGRPTKALALQRHELLLDTALEMFLERGFELTTIEALAASINMTKRTVYSRYDDKRALFRAVVQRAVEQWRLPIATLEALETDDIEETLLAIARIRAANTLSPAGLRLTRIINAESFRFPDILEIYQAGVRPTVVFLAALLRRHEGRELATLEDAEFEATAFLSLVSAPGRTVVLGQPADPVAIERRVQQSVRLFLNGIRRR